VPCVSATRVQKATSEESESGDDESQVGVGAKIEFAQAQGGRGR